MLNVVVHEITIGLQ